MSKVLSLLLTLVLCTLTSFSQVSFTGSSATVSTGNDAATVVVDNTLVITTNHQIDGVRVYIKDKFSIGDKLEFDNTAKPATVTGNYEPTTGVLLFTGVASASEYQALLRTVIFTASASGIGNRVIEFDLGVKVPFNGNFHYYEYVPGSVSWTTAKANAEARTYFGLQGYLVTITSQAENDFVYSLIGENSWIGASDNSALVNAVKPGTYPGAGDPECRYYWVTGPEAGTLISTGSTNPTRVGPYMNWNSGEPSYSATESYAQMYKTANLAGKWNDDGNGPHGYVGGYVVEYGGMDNSVVVDATHSVTVEVASTNLKTTSLPNQYSKNSLIVVDNAVELTSGGLITDAKVTISGNFSTEDVLNFKSDSLPTGVTGSYSTSTGVLSFTGTATPSAWQKLFRTVTFQSASSGTCDRSITFSLGKLISGNNGHFYESITTTTPDWTTARDVAASRYYMGLQGYLATITSATENKLIIDKLTVDGWLGGSDYFSEVNAATLGKTTETHYTTQAQSESNFYWVTGPERGQVISTGRPPSVPTGGYANWNTEEPNNFKDIEHYLKMYTVPGVEGKWNDVPLSSALGMVVEYGGLPTVPGISLSSTRMITCDNILPVQGLSLHLKAKGSSVVLNWTVIGEENVSHYELLHSTTGKDFKKIATIKALDNLGQSQYTYTDNDAVNGTNYYKIIVVDEDGTHSYSELRSIVIKGTIELYPTLVNDQFTVYLRNAASSQLTLTDAKGAVLLRKTLKLGANNIETGSLARGIYFVQVTNEGQSPEVYKIVKQ